MQVGTKRKHLDDTEDDDESNVGDSPVLDDDEEGYGAHKQKPKTAPVTPRKGKSKAHTKTKGPSPAKKARTTNVPAAKATKSSTARKPKKLAINDAFDVTKVVNDTKISGDNPLFSVFDDHLIN